MPANFYLFNVGHGQCAALQLPNGQWCIFDLGCTTDFSPIRFILRAQLSLSGLNQSRCGFRFLHGTISHLHGDHLADLNNLERTAPLILRSVAVDEKYLQDCRESCSDENGRQLISRFSTFCSSYSPLQTLSDRPDYGGAAIYELSLPVAVARWRGGAANSRVNNASVVTRIDVYGNSILLCGDVEQDAWELLLSLDETWVRLRNLVGINGDAWRNLVSNVDILVAPHHGHRSAYSTDLLNLARPAVVLVSVQSRDPHVDDRYSGSPVRGITLNGRTYKRITTRDVGHIMVKIWPPNYGQPKGNRDWYFFDVMLPLR